jgi:ABC-type lipoprotein export system ATPase subunit
METIKFHSVIPQVFAQRTEWDSQIWNVDATFQKGHLYLVEADSGKGKSTFCSYILGYRHDHVGTVCFDDEDTSVYTVSQWVEMRKNHISHLFQELRLFPELTALENIQIKNQITGFKSLDQIKTWFEMLGIDDKLDAKVGRMSFGQQQRVAMIRALVQPFDFILADEPISHLDDNNALIMSEIMMKEAHEQGAGVIVTSIGKHMDLDYEKTFKL